jgi:hypothetical protein
MTNGGPDSRKNKRSRRRGSWVGRKERRGRGFVEWFAFNGRVIRGVQS